MSELLVPSDKIYVATSRIVNAGRGVFAAMDISAGVVIERCPVIEIPDPADYERIKATKLRNYYFMWGEDHRAAICLGFGTLYNHSYNPNATYNKRLEDRVIDFVALADIPQDEEITVNYNHGDPCDKTALWIDDVPAPNEQ